MPSVVPALPLNGLQKWLSEIPPSEKEKGGEGLVGMRLKATSATVRGPSIILSLISDDIEKHQVFNDPTDTFASAALEHVNDLANVLTVNAPICHG